MFKLILYFLFSLSLLADNNPQYDSYEQSLKKIVSTMQSKITDMIKLADQTPQTAAFFNSSETLSSQVYKSAIS